MSSRSICQAKLDDRVEIDTVDPNFEIGHSNGESLKDLLEDEGTQVRNTRIVSVCSLILSTRGVLIALNRPI